MAQEVAKLPTIALGLESLEEKIGEAWEDIIEKIPLIGADSEIRISDGAAYIEVFPDRPDMFSLEGIIRAMRGFLGKESGLPEFPVSSSGIELHVDPSVADVRSEIVCGVVKGLKLTESEIEGLMALQEDLHDGLGRGRRKVSVGIHDISKVKPPFTYTTVDPTFKFIPLDFSEEMNIKEVLSVHPKGREYGYIVEGKGYPVILDVNNEVLSFPPVINGDLTRLTKDSKDVFIDVTGTDKTVESVLNIIATSLNDQGGRLESVQIIRTGSTVTTPDLTPSSMDLEPAEVRDLIGLPLEDQQIMDLLEKMRFGVEKKDSSRLRVKIPAYRSDVIHTWDLIEDIAIAYGYNEIPPVFPSSLTVGGLHPLEELKDSLRGVMAGLGYFEVITFSLSNVKKQFEQMRKEEEPHLRVSRPISEEHTMLRTSILPNLMEILSLNTHNSYPQTIFEVGEVIVTEDNTEKYSLAAVSIHPKATFAEIKSVVTALFNEFSIKVEITPSSSPSFLEGRQGNVMIADMNIGIIGEVHPAVITCWGLSLPVVGLEIDISGFGKEWNTVEKFLNGR